MPTKMGRKFHSLGDFVKIAQGNPEGWFFGWMIPPVYNKIIQMGDTQQDEMWLNNFHIIQYIVLLKRIYTSSFFNTVLSLSCQQNISQTLSPRHGCHRVHNGQQAKAEYWVRFQTDAWWL